ncbi:TonB-dependent receptor [Thalassotalea crassostreae]|uniref:TonB-dependent receptor n=1 Tax=Thalassotalea crassostreae TaxID=1763536 RepID=UPI0008381C2A|nr:TonB-dependent receptor [Thalassotalea crassostreae]
MKVNNLFSLTLTALSISCALNTANAAEAESNIANDKAIDSENIEVIQIEGIRGSLEDALNKKRAADQVMDSISAEDVGKFPDENIAEALQRIAGVSISRDAAGEGEAVSIRGMGPEMNLVTLNGQGLAGTGEVSETGQGFSFGMLSSDMISSLEVWKSPLASQDAGGVGGTVNIRTRQPLEYGKTRIQLGGGVGHQEIGDNESYKANFRMLTQYFDNTLGLSVGIDASDSPSENHSAGATKWATPRSNNATFTPAEGVEPIDDRLWSVQNYNIGTRAANREKLSADVTVQWRPNDEINFTLGGLVAQQNDDDISKSLRLGWTHKNHTSTGLYDDKGFIFAKSILDYGGQSDIDSQTWMRDTEREIESFNSTLEWLITEDLTLSLAAGTSKGHKDIVVTFDTFEGSVDNASYLYNGGMPYIRLGDDNTLPMDSEIQLTGMTHRVEYSEDESNFYQFDVDYITDFSLLPKVSLGAKKKEESTLQTYALGKLKGDLGTMEDHYGSSMSGHSYHRGSGLEHWSIADQNSIQSRNIPYTEIPLELETTIAFDENGEIIVTKQKDKRNDNRNWDVQTDITAAYIQSEIEADIVLPMRGNIGVRYEKTELTGHSITELSDGSYEPATDHHDYDDLLPSLNLVAELSEEVLLRFSSAEVISRPKSRFTSPARKIKRNAMEGTPGDASSGNIELKPFRALQFDVGVEWYFEEGALLSATWFKKDVDNYISKEVVFEGEDTVEEDDDYYVEKYVDGGEGNIEGIEITYQQAFTFLPGFLANTGGSFNYTYTDSETESLDLQFDTPLPMEGLSENTVNATLYYEVKNFSARIAYTYRDEFLFSGTNSSGNSIWLDASTYVDVQFNYKLNKSVSFGLTLNNLTSQETEKYVYSTARPVATVDNGRRAMFKVNAKF